MKLAVFGTGYVGLVTGTCFADLGNDVTCVDVDKEKIALLDRGATPIYEPGLTEKLERAKQEGRLTFTTDAASAIEQNDLLFICVGTPAATDGSVDLQYVEAVAKTIGAHMNEDKIIVNKSTVPVGTAARVNELITKALAKHEVVHACTVVSNPEFLREGAAVNDFFNPDRVIIGLPTGENAERARRVMGKLYQSVARTTRPIVYTDTKSAELIKYASNAMLATRISFINQLSQYCGRVGADITAVAKGMGYDTRIGPRFLHAGIGYGGSCFPKDVQGLITSINAVGGDASIFTAVHEANEAQKESLAPKITKALGGVVKGKRVALWGLAFKPKTDDIREAPSLVITRWLQAQGATIAAFDPEAMEHFKKEHDDLAYGTQPYDVVKDADVLVLVTEWDEFRNPDWRRVKKLMRSPNVIDGRNIWLAYREELASLGFTYQGVGVPSIKTAEATVHGEVEE